MEVYSVIVDSDNFNRGVIGVFSTFINALDILVISAKKQDSRLQGIEINTSDLDVPLPEHRKNVYFCFIYSDRHVVDNAVVIDFKILIRYPEDNQDIFKILTEYKFPFDTTFKPWN